MKFILLLSSIFLFGQCTHESQSEIELLPLSLETNNSGEPNLFTSSDGETYISWVEYVNDTMDALQFSKLENDSWGTIRTIASGGNWFVNWADFPSLVSGGNGNLTAHWLQKRAGGTYDYDVRISQSHDDGATWSESFVPHKDSISAEHGFVSLVPTPDGKTFITWLDGRNTKNEEKGAMTLRVAEILADGTVESDEEVDNRICDCCQTGATWTNSGPIVVYRDRSVDEVRDIGIVKRENGEWRKPSILHNDGWKISGCPVNGPAVDSYENQVSVAWYTEASGKGEVFLSMSMDMGDTFADPIKINQGSAMGRVDVITEANRTIVIWMENREESSEILIKTIENNGKASEPFILGRNSAERISGFPRITKSGSDYFTCWTDAQDSVAFVKTFKFSI